MTKQPVQVAVAVIFTGPDSVLLSQRAAQVHLGGMWEFPGGKLEPGESARDALERELQEELAITPESVTPILRLPFQYPEKSVLLHVFRVDSYSGVARGVEGQAIRSCPVSALDSLHFPPANAAIVRWLQLPDFYLISDPPGADDSDFVAGIGQRLVGTPGGLLQFRAPGLAATRYQRLATQVLELCQQHGSRLVINHSLEMFQRLTAHGLHLSAKQAQTFHNRPIDRQALLGCSCHNAAELEQAARLEADFVVLSLVKPSASHPQQPAMGWEGFAGLCNARRFAVYALGGMQKSDLRAAQQLGARGIAGISGI